jgi:putative FmdB family regulatory protein
VPLYEYQCDRCGRFEIIRKFSDPAVSVCPTCGDEVQKLPSAPAIQFKGTGWYVTDYARKSPGGDGAGKGGETAPASGDDKAGSKDRGSKDAGSKDAGSKDGGSKDGSSAPKASTSQDSPAPGGSSPTK